MAKFRKHKIVLEILSDDETFNPDKCAMDDLAYMISEGPFVGRTLPAESEDLTPKQMADDLYKFESEPGFFGLDDDGNEVDE